MTDPETTTPPTSLTENAQSQDEDSTPESESDSAGSFMNADRRYGLRYTLSAEPGMFSRPDAGERQGLTDALLFVSILREGVGANAPGSKSIALFSCDGSNDGHAIQPQELFQIWGAIAASLTQTHGLPLWQHEVATAAFERIRALVMGSGQSDPFTRVDPKSLEGSANDVRAGVAISTPAVIVPGPKDRAAS